MNQTRGFSLIEMIVTLGIVLVLASLSVVYYQHQVTQARRVDAKVALLDLAGRLESYHFDHLTYEGATPPGLGLASTTENQDYTLQVSQASVDSYLIQAIPTLVDSGCGTFTLNAQGVRGVTGSSTAEACWIN